jgi:hypothetical protein
MYGMASYVCCYFAPWYLTLLHLDAASGYSPFLLSLFGYAYLHTNLQTTELAVNGGLRYYDANAAFVTYFRAGHCCAGRPERGSPTSGSVDLNGLGRRRMQLPWNLSSVHVLMVQRKNKAAGYASKIL